MVKIRETGTAAEIRRMLMGGMVVTGLVVVGIGGWAVFTEIAGAVAAPGQLVVDTHVKEIQHPLGGVVAELLVRDGDRVRKGDLLVRLDKTVARANLAVVDKELLELGARQARAEAERDGRDTVTFPAELEAGQDDPAFAEVLRGEARLFALRKAARDSQKSQLTEQLGQLEQEIRGLDAQLRAARAEKALIAKELEGARQLWESKLVTVMRLTALERDAAGSEGRVSSLVASIAKARGKLSEINLKIMQIDQDLSAEVGKELAQIRARTAELAERRVTAGDQLRRIDIRAPQDGLVHQLAVHTIGGVIPPGGTIMQIVPEGDGLTVESRIPPHEIDRVSMGQMAVLRFSAFNQATTPELFGEVNRISADISQDPHTGTPYYTVRIGLSDPEIARLAGRKLLPGMPVEGFIQTGTRTVASYLTKPLQDHLVKAWRED